MEIRVIAPNRIDLAGGTTDIYPLCLFLGGGYTVNAGITVSSTAILRTLDERTIRIVSQDLVETQEAGAADRLSTDGPLGLIARAIKAFPPAKGLEVITRNEAPAGSGLGASSALLVATLAGLLRLRAERKAPEDIIDLAANIETAAIGVPTGKQDYVAAFYGGVSAIEFGYTGYVRHGCCQEPASQSRLEEMLVLSHTGEGRFSGMNNWEITKGFIDKAAGIREKLFQIRDVARNVCQALDLAAWNEFPRLVDQEWNVRRSLAPGITNPRIDAMMAAANAAGALANKICGAGGGGCMVTVTDPRDRTPVERAIVSAGGTPLAFRIAREGLKIEAFRD